MVHNTMLLPTNGIRVNALLSFYVPYLHGVVSWTSAQLISSVVEVHSANRKCMTHKLTLKSKMKTPFHFKIYKTVRSMTKNVQTLNQCIEYGIFIDTRSQCVCLWKYSSVYIVFLCQRFWENVTKNVTPTTN